MKKALPLIIVGVLLLLLLGGYFIWQSLTVPASMTSTQKAKNVVNMAAQPKWVQDLKVTAKVNKSGRLPTLTFTVSGIPANTVDQLNYTAYFDTTNRGTQGSANTKDPIDIKNKTEYSQTFDLGTCSSGTCLVYAGVANLELELDFLTPGGEAFSWAKMVDLQ